jgi:hypothetical protein
MLSLDLGDFLSLERFLFKLLPSALSFGCSESFFPWTSLLVLVCACAEVGCPLQWYFLRSIHDSILSSCLLPATALKGFSASLHFVPRIWLRAFVSYS